MTISIKSLTPIIFAAAVGFLFSSSASAADASAGSSTPSATPSPARVQGTPFKQENLFDETYQFIFFATLEGLYRDGVSSADVDSLLATKGKDGGYLNFIYTCPTCMPVVTNAPSAMLPCKCPSS